MDGPDDVPRVFANRLIKMLMDGMIAGGLVLEPSDYLVLRAAFRQVGGDWVKLTDGTPEQLTLLKGVVSAWAQMPGRTPPAQEFV